MENARQVLEVKQSLNLEVKSAIEDLRDKYVQLDAQESEFTNAMQNIQKHSRKLSEVEEKLINFERQLAVVGKSTDQIRDRLNDVRIEQALPSEQEEPLHENNSPFNHQPHTHQ